jgi:hypothetical protein
MLSSFVEHCLYKYVEVIWETLEEESRIIGAYGFLKHCETQWHIFIQATSCHLSAQNIMVLAILVAAYEEKI